VGPLHLMDPGCEVDSRRLPQLRRALLAWYEKNRRDLPWRKSRDPYRVWISEVMLQQTRVAAVVPRYEDFFRQFPSVERLASAKLPAVLAVWSGLGYYHRARNLHAAAKLIMREHGGRFPKSAESWRSLPGIGRYTAAAIASIAFAEPVAVLDGNVDRVLRRLVGASLSTAESWHRAQQLLDGRRPGDFNQAMMELGATTCLPGIPLCGHCPIRKLCRTRGRGTGKNRKPRPRKASLCYGLARRGDSVFLVRRAAQESLMPGMWELPKADDPADCGAILFRVRHSITVTDYLVTVVAQAAPAKTRGRWVRLGGSNRLPLTGLAKKILLKARIIQ
jgi:A/G-specific adenine glycosylase